MAPCAGSVTLANNVTRGKWTIVYAGEHSGGSISSGDDPGVIGVISADEPSTLAQYDTMVSSNKRGLVQVMGRAVSPIIRISLTWLMGILKVTIFPTIWCWGNDTRCQEHRFVHGPVTITISSLAPIQAVVSASIRIFGCIRRWVAVLRWRSVAAGRTMVRRLMLCGKHIRLMIVGSIGHQSNLAPHILKQPRLRSLARN